jgi:hypothetical protein
MKINSGAKLQRRETYRRGEAPAAALKETFSNPVSGSSFELFSLFRRAKEGDDFLGLRHHVRKLPRGNCSLEIGAGLRRAGHERG